MILKKSVGIVSHGVYLPNTVIPLSEIEKAQNKKLTSVSSSLGVDSKTVPALDEDTITMAASAAWQALMRTKIKKADINSLFVGSESHPYAVKPSGTVLAQALGLSNNLSLADLQFACKAGTQALQISLAYVLAGLSKLSLAIGADTAQAAPGDALEFTASAGAAAYLIGKTKLIAKIIATTSVASDTPDFWRRPREAYPKHAGRFTGGPAYFKHVYQAASNLLKETHLQVKDLDFCVFHTPNAKFPKMIARKLGFTQQQLAPSLIVQKVGNTYAAASLLALAAVLDLAPSGSKILVTSYGSGAGADAFLLETTKHLVEQRKNNDNFINQQLRKTKKTSYQDYLRRMNLARN